MIFVHKIVINKCVYQIHKILYVYEYWVKNCIFLQCMYVIHSVSYIIYVTVNLDNKIQDESNPLGNTPLKMCRMFRFEIICNNFRLPPEINQFLSTRLKKKKKKTEYR